MGLTTAQENAINAKGNTLLVSAAAGSGKTFTLTKRIIESIIENNQDLSRLLIVTFTRAAAAELREKISKALSEAISKNPDNVHLQRQLIKLGTAHISTIDSFFSEPIRTNFEKLSLPASIRLSDEAELSSIRDSAMQETIEAFLERDGILTTGEFIPAGEGTSYTDLLGIITAARSSSSLIPTLTDVYRKLITSPEGVQQLRQHSKRMRDSASLPFFDTDEGALIHKHLTSLVSYVCSSFELCCNMLIDEPRYHECFTENKSQCDAIASALKQRDYNRVKAAFDAFAPMGLPRIPKASQPPEAEKYKTMRSQKLIPEIRKARDSFCSMTSEEITECFLRNAELCDLLCDILLDFEARYTKEKLRRGLCEFSDMPKLMLKLLLNEDGSPTEYCLSLRESFDEVYIDEYQDVNEIQDKIFELIGTNRRFMVGDIKQSIYGFREAEPSIFADYRRRFTPYGDDSVGMPEGNTIFMSNNFRCDQNVITFTNTVCSQIFSAFSKSIGYTKDDDLIFSKNGQGEGYVSPVVKVNLIETQDSDEDDEDEIDEAGEQSDSDTSAMEASVSKSLSDEAIVTANEIARLISSDSERRADGKRIRAGDIAVLVRGHSHAKPLMAALDLLNIRYTTSSKGAVFEDKELNLLIDLLSVIDNPRDDIPLSRFVTADTENVSPVFTLEELIEIGRGRDKSASLYDAMLDYSKDPDIAERCREFTALNEKMRRMASRVSADKLLRAVIHSERLTPLANTEAYAYVYDCACKYTRNNWNGLSSFLTYFKALAEKGEGGAEPGAKDNDAVTIMTIHQSKGLEFCVCMLFGLGKKFNMSDSRSPIIFSKDFGVSMKLPPKDSEADAFEKVRARYADNPLVKAADIRLKEKQLEEEARIFYVALTRARERLYLSATLRKAYLEIMDEIEELPDPVYEISQGKTYINQTLIAISRHINKQIEERYADNNDFFEINVFGKGLNFLDSPIPQEDLDNGDSADSNMDVDISALVNGRISESIEEGILSSIPSKVAASKVSSRMLDDSIFLPIPLGSVFSESADEDKTESVFDRENLESIKRRIELMRSSVADFDSLLEVNKKPTAAERGTATHEFLQFCDYENVDENGIDAEIERLLTDRFITERTAKIIDRDRISGFFESELYREIRKAKKVYREFRFGMFRPASDFTEDEGLKKIVESRTIFVQGSTDLIIERENGEILLCDYKTDRISTEQKADRARLIADMTEKHGEQLKEYRNAVSSIFGRVPTKMYIYSVMLGDTVEINLP